MSEINPESRSDISKQNKLLTDYKLLREKYSVLKNALLNEKSRNKTFESNLSELNIQSRKATQEIDSLKFRNDLLTKQVNTLRDELEQERIKKHRRSSKETISNDEIDVLREELMNKIKDCSSLHKKIDELTNSHKSERDTLRSAISDLENQLKLIQSNKDAEESVIRISLSKEREDKHKLESKIEHKEQTILRLTQNEQTLLKEIADMRNLQMNYSPSKSQQSLPHQEESISLEVENKVVPEKDPDSLTNSFADSCIKNSGLDNGISTGVHTNENYLCSLIDRISVLEKALTSAELKYEVALKRFDCDNGNTEKMDQITITLGKTLEKFYQEKIDKITELSYRTISKCALYYDEMKLAEQRYDAEIIEKNLVQKENGDLKQRIILVQEDLDITRRQYEDKLKEMSIHIAELSNEISDNFNTHNKSDNSAKGFINSFKKH